MAEIPLPAGSSHVTVSSSSTFRSLVSPTSIRHKLLPRYMRPNSMFIGNSPLSGLPFSRSSLEGPGSAPAHPVISQFPQADMDTPGSGGTPLRLFSKGPQEVAYEALLAAIESLGAPGNEPVLRYSKGDLTREELRAVINNGDSSKAVLSAYFYALKRKNGKRMEHFPRAKRVKLYSPNTTEALFSLGKSDQVHVQSDPFAYE